MMMGDRLIRHPAGAVIVGASLAGMTVATELAARDYPGPITVIGDESHQAYARPPLSKGVLKGTESDESVLLPHSPSDRITVRVSTAATGLDVRAAQLLVGNGDRIPYDHLIIATGGRPRVLGDGAGQCTLRSLDDARRLRGELSVAEDVVVIGGGFLGMEVASAAVASGCRVTVVDVRPPLTPVLGDVLADLVLTAAAERGVDVRVCPTGVRVDCRHGGTVRAVTTGDGDTLPADVVVSAIGDVPNTEWLRSTGIRLDPSGWVIVDDHACVTAPGAQPGTVLAAGDVTVLPYRGALRRMPHWENAIGQAKAAASTVLGSDGAPYVPDPYFWSEAFGIGYKIAGPIPVTGDPVTLKGSLAQRSALVHWSTDSGTTVAAINHRIPVAKLKRHARELQLAHAQ